MLKKIEWKILSCVLLVLRIFPIKRNKIVFSSYHGSKYACNPRYIYEELKKRNVDIDSVWVLPKNYKYKPDARIVQERSLRALFEFATAHIWIDNCRKSIWMRKRKTQYYIQTWHAGISNKLGEKYAESELPHEYILAAKNDSQMADLFLSNSKWLTDSYRKSFWYDGEIMEEGLPREDYLCGNHEDYHLRICNHFGIEHNTHIVLYAPTFRNDGRIDAYNMNYNRLLNVLEQNEENWCLIIRLHPNVHSTDLNIEYNNRIINGSDYPEINDLILASDLFISDYSSCIFDAMLARCKVLIYASDIEEYQKNERSLAFTWDDLPFPLAINNDSLESNIMEFDCSDYYRKIDAFMDKCGFFGMGNASKAVADRVIEILNI